MCFYDMTGFGIAAARQQQSEKRCRNMIEGRQQGRDVSFVRARTCLELARQGQAQQQLTSSSAAI
jgi:hypothetical protein